MKTLLSPLLVFALALGFLSAEEQGAGSSGSQGGIHRGPLKISADETVSKERGKIIEASGNVAVRYELESGDLIDSFSQFARYNEKDNTGELWGAPQAVWKRNDPKLPRTTLQAERIFLNIKEEKLEARGDVVVVQASSTLKAQEVQFSNAEKRMTAQGGRPLFSVRETEHSTLIHSDRIVALTEDRQIHFTGRVQGIVHLQSSLPGPQ